MQAVLLLSVTVSGIVGTMCGCVSSMPVLMEFYNATNGPLWTQSSGWGSADCNVSWFGVTCALNVTDGSRAITEVNLTSNNLSGSLTESLANLTALESLLLGSNYIRGTLAESLSINIKSLDLSGNQLTGTLPSSWGKFVDIRYLSVAHNNLEGTLPDSWKTIQSSFGDGLVVILSFNRIGGPLPGNWSQLSTISELWLDHNNLHGSLPDSWSTMGGLFSPLTTLVLDGNPIGGPLPSSWGGMFNIAVLSVANCSLYGTLPSSWQFSGIEQLFLNDNALSGTMPPTWGNMGAFDVFSFANISNNCLSGNVPWANLQSGDHPPVMDTCGTRLNLATGNCTRLPTFWPAYCSPPVSPSISDGDLATLSDRVRVSDESLAVSPTAGSSESMGVFFYQTASPTTTDSVAFFMFANSGSIGTAQASATVTSAVIAGGIGASSGRGGVVALQRALTVIRLTSTCASGTNDGEGGASFSGWPENILTLSVAISSSSDAVLDGAAGAVIGNAVLLAAFSVVLHGVWLARTALHQGAISNLLCRRLCHCIPAASLPGSMVPMYSLMMPPSINAAIALLTLSQRTTPSVVLGCIALVVWLCPLGYFGYQLLFCCRVPTSDHGPRCFVLESSFLARRQEWTRYWMHPVTTNWEVPAELGAFENFSHDNVKRVATFALRRLEPLFSSLVPSRTWYQLAEWSVSLASSVAVGLAIGTGGCNAARVGASIAVALTALEVVLLLVLRPLRVRFELAVGVVVSCIALAADISALLEWSSASSNCVLAGSVVELVAMTATLLFEICVGRRQKPNEAGIVDLYDDVDDCHYMDTPGLLFDQKPLLPRNDVNARRPLASRCAAINISQREALITLVKLICKRIATGDK